MLFGDLKRAIEDTILKPETNRLSDIGKRTTIAALDLVQVEQTRPSNTPNFHNESYLDNVGTLNSCSQEPVSSLAESGYTTSSTTSDSVAPPVQSFSSSNSLDTVVLRQSISCRPSLGTSRRSSRVLSHYSQTKRKRSNSVSSGLSKSRSARQGTSSGMGVSCTSTGGASALSLPPTARQTPFRFGETEEKIHMHSNSSDGPSPGFQLGPYEASAIMDGFEDDRLNSGNLASANEWAPACHIDDGALHKKAGAKPSFRKFESEKLLRDVQSVDENSTSAFDSFRQQQKTYDSDCDEEMDCD